MSDIDSLVKAASAAADQNAIEAIIKQALSVDGLWAFGELIESPGVAALSGKSKWYSELEIFCYGTWLEHQKEKHVDLTEQQAKKLRQLTIATLAARSGEVSYAVLKTELEIQDLRTLEDLLLETMYSGLIEGKLDQQRHMIIVDFAQGRDVRSEDIKKFSDVLNNWLARSRQLNSNIEERINTARSEITVEEMRKQQFEARVKEIKENLRAILEAQEGGMMEGGRGLGGRRGGGHRGGGGRQGQDGGIGGFFGQAAQGIRRGFFNG